MTNAQSAQIEIAGSSRGNRAINATTSTGVILGSRGTKSVAIRPNDISNGGRLQ